MNRQGRQEPKGLSFWMKKDTQYILCGPLRAWRFVFQHPARQELEPIIVMTNQAMRRNNNG
jgi:hypothetical protein